MNGVLPIFAFAGTAANASDAVIGKEDGAWHFSLLCLMLLDLSL